MFKAPRVNTSGWSECAAMCTQDNGWPPSPNRKDATAFIRAVKRYGLEARLPQIAAEVGPVMEEAPEDAKCALCNLLKANPSLLLDCLKPLHLQLSGAHSALLQRENL